jgi:hypothetical protein
MVFIILLFPVQESFSGWAVPWGFAPRGRPTQENLPEAKEDQARINLHVPPGFQPVYAGVPMNTPGASRTHAVHPSHQNSRCPPRATGSHAVHPVSPCPPAATTSQSVRQQSPGPKLSTRSLQDSCCPPGAARTQPVHQEPPGLMLSTRTQLVHQEPPRLMLSTSSPRSHAVPDEPLGATGSHPVHHEPPGPAHAVCPPGATRSQSTPRSGLPPGLTLSIMHSAGPA